MTAYTDSASLYDVIYGQKDYEGEVRKLRKHIARYMTRTAETLLDVACGTGGHLAHLHTAFQCAGLDLSPGLLDTARRRLPAVPFYEADMCDFNLGEPFDVVTCLFSAIGYVGTLERLHQAAAAMAWHVAPGGLLIVEPWFTPETFKDGYVFSELIEQPNLHLVRMSVSKTDGALSIIDLHHLVATPDGVTHFVERHELALFTHAEYIAAFEAAGLRVIHDADGLIGRGLYIGVKDA